MALRRPLVVIGGVLQELPVGDTLPSAGAGGGNACTCVLDFGTGDHDASVVVTGQTWVEAGSVIVASAVGEDARVEQIVCNVGALVAGVGFTVYAHAPNGAVGTYTVNCVGV